MFTDSKGRGWMAPFRRSICYYFKGKIHNQENDPMLSRVHLRNNINSFAEDNAGNILVGSANALYYINTDGGVREFDSIAFSPIRGCDAVSASIDGHFLVQTGQEV